MMYRAVTTTLMACLLAVSWSSSVMAEEKGANTRALLEMQRNGSQASETPRPMSGDQADNIHERYLESFKHPIPEFYRDPDETIVDSN